MLKDLLPEKIFSLISCAADVEKLTELRMRIGKPLSAAELGDYRFPTDADGKSYTVTKEDIDYVLAIATKNSVYAVNNMLASGFLACDDGIRIGVSGEAVYKNGRLFTLKNINSLCIRIPRQIFGCASALGGIVSDFGNTLIISPPGMGKTTILRELVRLLSESGKNVIVVDERNELSASVNGIPLFDLGPNTDVLLFSSKSAGYEGAVRALRPDVLATDEVFGKAETDCLADIYRSGVGIVATVHAKDAVSLLKDKNYSVLGGIMRYFVELGDVGKVTAVIDKEKVKRC